MISIITAIHNGLAINKFYVASLKKYTVNEFELIIIDNASTDGSREFFKSEGYQVIHNSKNYSYPFCQNQGINIARGDYLFFLNNDIIVCPDWDDLMINVALQNKLDVLSACDNGNVGNIHQSKNLRKKWKRIKYSVMQFGVNNITLNLMIKLMYWNWESFCKSRLEKYKNQTIEGIVGHNLMMTKRGLQIIGTWDERIQSADFDIFMKIKKMIEEGIDIKPCHITLGVFIHHFSRMTSKYSKKPEPFADEKKLINISEKWTIEEQQRFHPDNAILKANI